MNFLTPSQSHALLNIYSFFDIWSLPAVLQQADIIFCKAASDKAWRPPNPWHAVQYCRQLWKLSKAAYALHKVGDEAFHKAIMVNHGDAGPDLCQPQHFVGDSRSSTPFIDMPRSLSAAQYGNPAKALKAFCRYRSKRYWKKFYHRLAECALSPGSRQGYEAAGKLLKLQQHILRLIEACHLIHVRLGKTAVAML